MCSSMVFHIFVNTIIKTNTNKPPRESCSKSIIIKIVWSRMIDQWHHQRHNQMRYFKFVIFITSENITFFEWTWYSLFKVRFTPTCSHKSGGRVIHFKWSLNRPAELPIESFWKVLEKGSLRAIISFLHWVEIWNIWQKIAYKYGKYCRWKHFINLVLLTTYCYLSE